MSAPTEEHSGDPVQSSDDSLISGGIIRQALQDLDISHDEIFEALNANQPDANDAFSATIVEEILRDALSSSAFDSAWSALSETQGQRPKGTEKQALAIPTELNAALKLAVEREVNEHLSQTENKTSGKLQRLGSAVASLKQERAIDARIDERVSEWNEQHSKALAALKDSIETKLPLLDERISATEKHKDDYGKSLSILRFVLYTLIAVNGGVAVIVGIEALNFRPLREEAATHNERLRVIERAQRQDVIEQAKTVCERFMVHTSPVGEADDDLVETARRQRQLVEALLGLGSLSTADTEMRHTTEILELIRQLFVRLDFMQQRAPKGLATADSQTILDVRDHWQTLEIRPPQYRGNFSQFHNRAEAYRWNWLAICDVLLYEHSETVTEKDERFLSAVTTARNAIRVDPEFALAHSTAGRAYLARVGDHFVGAISLTDKELSAFTANAERYFRFSLAQRTNPVQKAHAMNNLLSVDIMKNEQLWMSDVDKSIEMLDASMANAHVLDEALASESRAVDRRIAGMKLTKLELELCRFRSLVVANREDADKDDLRNRLLATLKELAANGYFGNTTKERFEKDPWNKFLLIAVEYKLCTQKEFLDALGL